MALKEFAPEDVCSGAGSSQNDIQHSVHKAKRIFTIVSKAVVDHVLGSKVYWSDLQEFRS